MSGFNLAACLGLALHFGVGHPQPGYLDPKTVIHSIAFNTAQSYVAILEEVPFIRIYEFPSLQRKAEFKLTHVFSAMALSPCGRYLAVNGNGSPESPLIKIVDLKANPPNVAKGLVPLTPLRRGDDGGVASAYDFHFSDDGEGLAAFDSRPIISFWKWRTDARAEWEATLIPRAFRDFRILNFDAILGTSNDGARWLLKREGKSLELSLRLAITRDNPVLESWTGDLKTALFSYWDAGIVEIHELAAKGRSRVIATLDCGKLMNSQEHKVEFAHAAVSRDRSVVIVSYADAESAASVAFFPTTPERYKELGLDPATQTHLVLRIQGKTGRTTEPPGIVFSPDGRWFVFQGCPAAEPRFWDMNNIGRQLLAEKTIDKK